MRITGYDRLDNGNVKRFGVIELRKRRTVLSATVILVIVLMIAASANVVLGKWEPDGNPVFTSAREEVYVCASGDGSGGVIMFAAVLDNAGSTSVDLEARKIQKNGSPAWEGSSATVCADKDISANTGPACAADGAGGAIVAWSDDRFGDEAVFARRVKSDGTVAWKENGVRLADTAGDQTHPVVVPDGEGGAFVVWEDDRNADTDIYAQRINSGGNLLWGPGGVPVCDQGGDQERPCAVSVSAATVVVAWEEYRNDPVSGSDIYVQKLRHNGSRIWTVEGVTVCEEEQDQDSPGILDDGGEGAVIVWEDWRDQGIGLGKDLYMRRVDFTGQPLGPGDTPLCAMEENQSDFSLVKAPGGDSFYAAWEDKRHGTGEGSNDIYAQRVQVEGPDLDCTWTDHGIPVCTLGGAQFGPVVTCASPAGDIGVIVSWSDMRSFHKVDCYSQFFTNNGAAQWTGDGTVVCDAVQDQFGCAAVNNGIGSATVVFMDNRSGESFDVYARRIGPRIESVDGDAFPGETVDITVTGEFTHFFDGLSSMTIEGQDVSVKSMEVKSYTEAVATVEVGSGAEPGARDLNVITPTDSGDEEPNPCYGGFIIRETEVQGPSDTWYLAEGSTGVDPALGNFETWVLVQNPGDSEATVNITYMTPGGAVTGPTVLLAPGSRDTVNVAETLPDEWSVSTRVQSDVPIIAERSMYWNSSAGILRQAAHDSIGAASGG